MSTTTIDAATEPFWVWWTLTLLLACGQIAQGWRRPREMLGFATTASLMWLYVYVYLPYHLIAAEGGALPATIWNLGQFTAFAALASLLGGWHWRLGRATEPDMGRASGVDYNRLWWFGIGALGVGLAGFYSFRISGQEFSAPTAYWYLLFNVCYPGMALCVLALSSSAGHRTVFSVVLFSSLAAGIIVPLALGARRGPTFVAIIALFFPFAAARRRALNPALVLSVLICGGLTLLLLVTARRVTYEEGGTWGEFLGSVRFEELTEERASRASDNEFYNHCVVLQANLATGRYQYGSTHLAMLLNWVPRSWWPDKPQRSLGMFPEAMYCVERTEGSNLGVGGGWGAVADAFNNYWFFFPLFFLGIGWGTAALFTRAQRPNAVEWKMYNVGLLCATHWFVAQSIVEAFVPFMIYEATFFFAFRYARSCASAPPRRNGQTFPPPAKSAAQAAAIESREASGVRCMPPL